VLLRRDAVGQKDRVGRSCAANTIRSNARTFPMLPGKASTDLTLSLWIAGLALSFEMVVAGTNAQDSTLSSDGVIGPDAYNSVAGGSMVRADGRRRSARLALEKPSTPDQVAQETRRFAPAARLSRNMKPVRSFWDELRTCRPIRESGQGIIRLHDRRQRFTARYLASKNCRRCGRGSYPTLGPDHRACRTAGPDVAQGTGREGPGPIPGIGESR